MQSNRSFINLTLLGLTLLALLLVGQAEPVAAKPLELYTTHPDDKAALVDLYNSTGRVLPWDINTDPCTGSVWEGITYCGVDDDFLRVEKIELSGRDLTGTIPTSIGNLPNLRWLDLSRNQLTGEIPASLGNLSYPLLLYLSNNQLTGEVPASLGNLESLYYFALSGNPLSGELPLNLTNLTFLRYFGFNSTCLEEPQDSAFQAWLNSIPDLGRNTEPHPDCDRSVVVEACIEGTYFLNDNLTSLRNRYDTQVDWADAGLTPDRVAFTLNGTTVSKSADTNPVSEYYNMDVDLNYSLLGTSNTLSIEAIAQNGSALGPVDFDLVGVSSPSWLPAPFTIEQVGTCEAPGSKSDVTYVSDFKFPPDEFLSIQGVIPDVIIPFYPDEPLIDLLQIQPPFDVTLKPSGAGTVKIKPEAINIPTGKFKLLGENIPLTLSAEGDFNIEAGSGIQLETASLTMQADATPFKKEADLATLLCKGKVQLGCILKEAEELPILGKSYAWFNDFVLIKGSITAQLNGTADFESKNDSLDWKQSEINGQLNGRVSTRTGLEYIGTAEVFGGGEGKMAFQFPASPDHFKSASAEFYYGYRLESWTFEEEIKESHLWQWPEPAPLIQPNTVETTSTGPRPIARDYLDGSTPYAAFVANDLTALSSTNETPIATNVFGSGYPDVAATEGQTILVWTHDDGSKPLMEAQEIYFSRYDGSSWSTPTGITNDSLQDFYANVAVDQNGQIVAVWQRNKNQQAADAQLNAAYTNGFEIATSVWNGSSWSQPALLTDDNAFDLDPTLVRGTDGQLLAVWRKNSAGELLSDAANPDQLMFALWNGSSWSQPAAIIDSVVGMLGLAPARHNDTTMSLVYSQDMDGDYSTSEDQELFQVAWNGSSWGSPVRLTTDTLPDNSPSLFYTSDGQPQLVWTKGNSLYGLIGDLSGTPVEIIGDGSGTLLDYATAQTPDNNLAMFWQANSEAGGDIFYAVYNAEQNAFSDVRQLTDDESLEAFMAPTIAPNGEVVVAYNETALVKEDVEIAPGEIIEGVTTFGQTDLYVLRDSIDFNALEIVYLPLILKNSDGSTSPPAATATPTSPAPANTPTPTSPAPANTPTATVPPTNTPTATPTNTPQPTWQEVGSGSASGGGISNAGSLLAFSPVVGVAPDGIPYLAWQHTITENDGIDTYLFGEIYVKRWDGSSWVEVGSGSASGYGVSSTGFNDSTEPTLAIAADGIPYVAWIDYDWYTFDSDIRIKRFNGSSWESLGGLVNDSGQATEPTLAIAPDGTPYLAWWDYEEIYVKRWNGSGWVEVGSGSVSGGGVSNNSGYSAAPSLAIAPDGTLYLAWSDDTSGNDEIYVKHFNGSSWVEVGSGSASGGGISDNSGASIVPELGIAPDGTLYLAWSDDTSGDREIYIKRWNGSSWVEVGSGSASGGGLSNNSGRSSLPDLAFTTDSAPFVVWWDDSDGDEEIYIKRWNGSSWVEVDSGSASGGGISDNSGNSRSATLSIGPDNIPYVVWEDDSSGNEEIYVKRWAP